MGASRETIELVHQALIECRANGEQPPDQSRLAYLIDKDKSAVTCSLKWLEHEGVITKEGAHRRPVLVDKPEEPV